MKHLLIILSLLILNSPLFGQSEETCYVIVDSSEEFNPTFLSNISVSIISQFLREVEPIPSGGVSKDSCLYQISVTKEQDTTFVTFKGKNLNSYGDSKLSGTDGFQQSLLKSLYRSLRDKRKLICEDYGTLLEECGGVVVQDVPKKVEPKVVEKKVSIPKVEPKVVEIPKVIPKKVQESVVQKTDQMVLYGKLVKDKRNPSKSVTKWFSYGNDKTDQKYVGETKNGLPNGKGTHTFPNGDKYIGEFWNGKRHGQGTIYWTNGNEVVGEFQNNEYLDVIIYDSNGDEISRIVK